MYIHYNHCHGATAHLTLNILLLFVLNVGLRSFWVIIIIIIIIIIIVVVVVVIIVYIPLPYSGAVRLQ